MRRAASRPSLNQQLADRVQRAIVEHSLHGDTYDGDYVVGVILEFLAAHDVVLTDRGISAGRYPRHSPRPSLSSTVVVTTVELMDALGTARASIDATACRLRRCVVSKHTRRPSSSRVSVVSW